MSGPITAIYVADPLTVMLSASAIRAAQAIAEGYARADNLRAEQQDYRNRLRDELKGAGAAGREAAARALLDAEAEFDTLAALAQRYVAQENIDAMRPARAQAGDALQQATYLHTLQALTGELRAILLTESARRMDDLGQAILPERDATALTDVQRLLARIAHLGELPQEIAGVAKEIADSPFMDTERVQLLTTELRMRIQRHVEAVRTQQVQAASALILQQSLKDLGYQVEEVSSTLFVEGGVVHFRRQGWDNYMVRMRVDARAGTSNFNVIRAVEDAGNEISVLDHLAEDRWCAEFPALLQALDVRGLHLNVTRRKAAGELPVQRVQKDKLPSFAEEEALEHRQKLHARELT